MQSVKSKVVLDHHNVVSTAVKQGKAVSAKAGKAARLS